MIDYGAGWRWPYRGWGSVFLTQEEEPLTITDTYMISDGLNESWSKIMLIFQLVSGEYLCLFENLSQLTQHDMDAGSSIYQLRACRKSTQPLSHDCTWAEYTPPPHTPFPKTHTEVQGHRKRAPHVPLEWCRPSLQLFSYDRVYWPPPPERPNMGL